MQMIIWNRFYLPLSYLFLCDWKNSEWKKLYTQFVGVFLFFIFCVKEVYSGEKKNGINERMNEWMNDE